MIPTIRGSIDFGEFPDGLCRALKTFLYQDTRPDLLARLVAGLRKLTHVGVTRIARKHSGVDPVYVRNTWDTLTSLDGLLWWNDGRGRTRTELLKLAWKKGGGR